ncbi:MAG: hypothetical protein HC819_04425 [Cyclobacteriaceae bacterium]|nr:hypothetical protein [Cyclobacteriaceae bacterium]
MKRFTKTTLAVLAIVVGTSAGAIAQKKSVRLDPVSKDMYRLTYFNQGQCNVKVEVIDAQGVRLLSEQINQKKSFTKPYSFENLKNGEYDFKVIDADGVYVSKITRSNEASMTAHIVKLENEKAKVIVRGEFVAPVTVKFLDRKGLLVFDDYIDQGSNFSKVYDLSRVNADEINIEVVTEEKLLATAEF